MPSIPSFWIWTNILLSIYILPPYLRDLNLHKSLSWLCDKIPLPASETRFEDFCRLPQLTCYFIKYGQSDTHYGSLKLLKLSDLARYFTCIWGSKFSSDFICASFDEAEHRFCFRDRFTLHSSTNHVESSISTTFSNHPLESCLKTPITTLCLTILVDLNCFAIF